MNSIYLSENLRCGGGWGESEQDEFQETFCWIGRRASLQVDPPPDNHYLYLQAGSPEFTGKRRIRLTCLEYATEQLLKPGWHVYQFRLPTVAVTGRPAELALTIDRLIDCPSDSRELGLMIKEVHCLPRRLDAIEWQVRQRQRRVEARCHYYQGKGRPGVLWLASFPRSGNTWMRFLLTNLLFKTVNESSQIAGYIDEIL